MLIDRYLLCLIALPFAATLGIFMCLLLLIRMADLLNYVIAEGGSVFTLAKLLVFLAPQYLALALPVGLLTGVILAFRRLSQDGEWDAMLAGGVSTLRLLRAPVALAGVVSLCVLFIAGVLQPLSLYNYEKLRFALEHGSGGISIAASEFRRIADGVVVRAREVRRGGTDLRGVFVSLREDTGSFIIAAQRARLEPGRVILEEGRLIRLGARRDAASFTTHEIPIAIPAPAAYRPRGTHERELTLTELLRGEGGLGPAAVEAGLSRRVAQAAVVLLLPFLGVAFARTPKRKKGADGLFAGLAFFLVFNELSLFGERMGFTGQAPSTPVQAAALFAFALLCFTLFARIAAGPAWRSPFPRRANA